MLQQALVDYIKSQLGLDVGKNEIRSALVGAGWPEADVDESFGSAEVTAVGGAPATPVVSGGSPVGGEQKPKETAVVSGAKVENAEVKADSGAKKFSFPFGAVSGLSKSGGGSIGQQGGGTGPIVVSDLVGGTKTSSQFGAVKKEEKPKEQQDQAKNPAGSKEAGPSVFSRIRLSKNLITAVVLGILVAGFATGAAWLYLQNKDLNQKIAGLEEGDAAAKTQAVELKSKIDSLTVELQAAQTVNKSLKLELSFIASPPGVTAVETDVSGLKAIVHGGGKKQYSLTTENGVEIIVSNSTDEGVDAALKPLVGQEAEISGKYTPGTSKIEITAVNGAAVEVVAPQK